MKKNDHTQQPYFSTFIKPCGFRKEISPLKKKVYIYA